MASDKGQDTLLISNIKVSYIWRIISCTFFVCYFCSKVVTISYTNLMKLYEILQYQVVSSLV